MFSPSIRPAIISALAALALYAITLPGTYVYDDRYIVQADPRLTDMSRWGEYLTKDYFFGGADNLYRPLVSLSYAVQVRLHGNDERHAWAFHLVNWLLHAGVCALLAELARRLTSSNAIALAAGLLFAAHPIHVEAVANIVGRAELMCALGMLGALVLFLRPLTIGRAVAIWACFVLALLSKEQGILLPILLLAAIPCRFGTVHLSSPLVGSAPPANTAIDYAQRDTPRAARFSPATLTLILLLLWTLASYLFFRERILKFWWDRSFLDWTINPIVHSQGIDRWMMPFALLGRYVALLVLPVKLTFDYGGAVIGSTVSVRDPYFLLGLATTIAAVGGCVWAIVRRAWSAVLCLLAFGLMFGMVSNLLTLIGTNFAERLMYIPSAFVCILAAMGVMKLPRRVAVAVLMIVVALYAVRAVTYAWRWNDRLRIYQMAVDETPRNVRLWMVLGEELSVRGQHSDAMRVMQRGREIEPGYHRIWMRSAVVAMNAGQIDEAERFAHEGHRIQPNLATGPILAEIAAARTATRPATQPSQ